MIERGLASISQTGTEAMVARLVHRMRMDGRIGSFQPIAQMPGFPRAIAAVITELRLARLSPGIVVPIAPDVVQALEAASNGLAMAKSPGIETPAEARP